MQKRSITLKLSFCGGDAAAYKQHQWTCFQLLLCKISILVFNRTVQIKKNIVYIQYGICSSRVVSPENRCTTRDTLQITGVRYLPSAAFKCGWKNLTDTTVKNLGLVSHPNCTQAVKGLCFMGECTDYMYSVGTIHSQRMLYRLLK